MAGTSITPTLAELRSLIKRESRLTGSDNLDDFIDGLVNELLCDYVQKQRYFETLKTNQIITTTLNNGTYNLPANFIAMRLVRYKQTSGYTFTLNSRGQFIETALGQRPRWYDIAADKLLIFPFDDVPVNETLLLDYWEYPPTLTSGTTFPIPKLVAPIKQEAIRRALIYNQQLQAAQIFKGDAIEIDNKSRVS